MRTARQALLFALRVGIAAGLLYWLLSRESFSLEALTGPGSGARAAALFGAGAACVLCGLSVLALRLRLLVRRQGFELAYRTALGLTAVGAFFGSVLPGLVGGDAAKALYLCGRVSERRMDALAAVVLDRVVGLYSLVLMGALAALAAGLTGAVAIRPVLLLAAPACAGVMTLGGLLLSWERVARCRLVAAAHSLLPGPAARLATALRLYGKSPRLVASAILLSGAALLRDGVSAFAHFVIDPLAMVMNAVPLTPGGLGVTESAFAFLFSAAGSPNGAVVGLLGRSIQYAVFAVAGCSAMLSMRLRFESQRAQPLPPQGLIERGAL
ncbi:MAG: lysylphosphatidylglycerol synthase transmembrane domain-containing protein [Planctomycetota bacterium]|jgi:uncharacterized membrane protein YbhN (UPF0104 family)